MIAGHWEFKIASQSDRLLRHCRSHPLPGLGAGMAESTRQRYEALGIDIVLDRHRGLCITPSATADIIVAGALPFEVTGPRGEVIADEYEIEIRIRPGFPGTLPTVYETSKRVPADYYKLAGGALCLGAPTEVRLILRRSPTLLTVVDQFVIPYLFGYSSYLRNGKMPYGELDHGNDGIRKYLAEMFGGTTAAHPEEFLKLASKKKRDANKCPCPCDSGRRLGRCHSRSTNHWRRRIGRHWFRNEYDRVKKLLKQEGKRN